MTFRVDIGDVQPSQLYLDAEKLASVLSWFDFDDPKYGPLPVYDFDGETCLTDGHTRAFAAHLAGENQLSVEYDEDLPEKYDVALYRECIEWCEEEGVTEVSDLAGRVVSTETFVEEWVERCQRAGERLE
jgi:hypothetical protein